ncbi:hypothetical protein LDE03_03530 [Lactobacillus delbrueckii subsp. delbrueckii]|nr:hypothetical protein LDE01_01410 [Lactobacillus delbrueckii subsp. delbrueckii]GEA74545.1 hypothetical protein LDE03_03530 [Lactobacillus delbrueckii subsp. delbrueckii]
MTPLKGPAIKAQLSRWGEVFPLGIAHFCSDHAGRAQGVGHGAVARKDVFFAQKRQDEAEIVVDGLVAGNPVLEGQLDDGLLVAGIASGQLDPAG